jgi:hypothetical protein
VLTVDETCQRHNPKVAVPPLAGHRLVALDRRNSDTLGQVGASSHRAGVRDDLDLHRHLAETGQDNPVEYIPLQRGRARLTSVRSS